MKFKFGIGRRRRHVFGPVNRNFNESTFRPRTVVQRLSTGVVEDSYTTSAEYRAAQMTVNNPWRQLKPSKLTPTARSLNYWARKSGMVEVTTNGPGGRKVVKTGPHFEPIATEWNRRFLSPTYYAQDEQLRTEAILEALQAVKDQKFNAGVFIAEMSGTIQMGYDAMNLIVRARNGLRNAEYGRVYEEFRRKTKAKPYPTWRRENWDKLRHIRSIRESKHIPSGWLYYHFGIAPTVADITDAVDAFGSRMAPLAYSDATFTRGYAKHTTKVVEKIGNSVYNGVMEHDVLRSVRVIIGVTPKSFVLGKLGELGVTNPVDAALNAVPFSWLLSYFTSFGEWVSVLDTSLAWNFDESWVESWRVVATSKFTPVTNAAVKYGYLSEPSTIYHKFVDRKVRKDFYGPMGTILPQVKRGGPSLQQISNMLSVLSSSMRIPIRP